MRKSSSPLRNCNSFIGNKIFGIALDELQHGQSDSEVPFIVRHIVGYIEEHGGLSQEGLFQISGNAETVEWLRQRYDNGEEVDLVKEADVPSAISLLRYFLQELPEPVIPASLHIHLMQLSQDSTDSEDFGRKVKCILQQLPAVNFSLLKFLCRFLSNIVSRHDEMWTTGALAAIFGPDVFQIYTDVEDMSEQETARRIVTGLLESYFDFFEAEDDEFSSTNDLSSITEQITDLFEDVEDEKLEQPEELPEDRTERVDEMRDLLHLEMTEDVFESCSVTASSSTCLSPINILPASSNILERSIRAAVEQHLFDLRSNLDQDLRKFQEPLAVCCLNAEENTCDREEIDKDKLNTSFDCSYSATGSDTENESVQQHSEKPEQDKLNLIFHNHEDEPSADILLELTNVDAENDAGSNAKSKRKTNGCFVDCDTFSSRLILDSYSEICDLNENPESDVNAGSSAYMYEDPVRIQIPHLELRSISEDDSFEEPFPAFKAWQDDAESGEAQLSPQAGRMNNPMEDDVFPVLSHRYLDFGQSQRFLHDPEVADSSKALSFVRTRRASFSSKDDTKDDKTPHQLVKKLQKKIRQFEDQFERDNKYKPSYTDLAANPKVLKWMTDLTKLRKQIKDAKQKSVDGDFGPQIRPRSNTLPKSFGSSLDHGHEEAVEEEELRVEKKPTREDTLELILKRLKEKRAEQGLPNEMKVMTKDNLAEEKTSLQKSLLYYESLHGRPVTREERQVVKPLYDRYRLVKQMLARASITPILGSPSTKRRGQMLQPIIEGETAHFFEEIKEEDEDGGSISSESSDTVGPSVQAEWIRNEDETTHSDIEEHQQKMPLDIRLSSSRATSMPELMEQLWRARAEKKKLRKTLREFEQQFFQQNGRNAQKEDRSQMLEEYREYKKIKAKLRLLEVLINKQDSSKSI